MYVTNHEYNNIIDGYPSRIQLCMGTLDYFSM